MTDSYRLSQRMRLKAKFLHKEKPKINPHNPVIWYYSTYYAGFAGVGGFVYSCSKCKSQGFLEERDAHAEGYPDKINWDCPQCGNEK